MKKLLQTSFLFASFLGICQKGYFDGYIVKLTGDTIRGKIADGVSYDGEMNYQKIFFLGPEGKREKFKPKDLICYQKKDFPPVRSMLRMGSRHFGVVQEEGAVILYRCFRTVGYGGKLYIGKKKDGGIYMIPAQNVNIEYYVQRKNDDKSCVHVSPSVFKSVMSKFFNDDADIKSRIEDKTIRLQHLQETVQEYNKKHP